MFSHLNDMRHQPTGGSATNEAVAELTAHAVKWPTTGTITVDTILQSHQSNPPSRLIRSRPPTTSKIDAIIESIMLCI